MRKTLAERNTKGFALVVTVSLLSLLILTLVAIATLTRIETAIGANVQLQTSARANAVFALDVALGELQRHAGPDSRTTANGGILGLGVENPNWVGVWNSDGTLRTWLVSGNENDFDFSDGSNFQPNSTVNGLVTSTNALSGNLEIASGDPGDGSRIARLLVGAKSVGDGNTADFVVAPTVDLNGPDALGGGNMVKGRYAWWVGDEGVKASMALPDLLAGVNYGPYDYPELQARLRQQVPLGHQSFRATDASASPLFGFDPAEGGNHNNLHKLVTRNQIPIMNPASGTGLLSTARERFHDWTNGSFGVLASTNSNFPGLKQDLSAAPELLGNAFSSWQNYSGYMAEPINPPNPAPTFQLNPPISDENDMRRRYYTTPPFPSTPGTPLETGTVVHKVAPVVSEFVIQFGFIRNTSASELEMRVRMHVGLWNPYTSALVREPLLLEIVNLGELTLSIDGGTELPVVFPLQGELNQFADNNGWLEDGLDSYDAFTLVLPFDTGTTSDTERSTWLPGRVSNWRTSEADDRQALTYYSKILGNTDGWNVPIADPFTEDGDLMVAGIENVPTSVMLILKRMDGTELGRYSGPPMRTNSDGNWMAWEQAFDESAGTWGFGFGFRLNQPSTGTPGATLLAIGRPDPRDAFIDESGTIAHNPLDGSDPSSYDDVSTHWNSDPLVGFLLNRPTQPVLSVPSDSPDYDTPIFELPRMPILSLGVLQHLPLAGMPPFSIGNSWGSNYEAFDDFDGNGIIDTSDESLGPIGSWFDRFFFTGVTDEVDRGEDDPIDPLPFYHLRSFNPGGSLDFSDLLDAGPLSSQHLLMAGAFNVNSTSIDAWEAVLRSLRPAAIDEWRIVDLYGAPNPPPAPRIFPSPTASTIVGSVTDSSQGPSAPTNSASGFMRFSQSAQEVFRPGSIAGGIDRSQYRQGFKGGDSGSAGSAGRNLDSVQIRALATAVVAEVQDYYASEGPIRSMEQFVSVAPGKSGSILENAIASTNINAGVSFLSSYWLSQADVLTAIGPMLQNRSDTFVVRAFGETVNPVTSAVEGRAWCEATVQRIPTPVDSDDNVELPAGPFGRRFQIVSFRWLTPEDI